MIVIRADPRGAAVSPNPRQLSNSLVISPVDDLRQAAFFLPWALLKDDEEAGIKVQRKFLEFKTRYEDIDIVATDAARYLVRGVFSCSFSAPDGAQLKSKMTF